VLINQLTKIAGFYTLVDLITKSIQAFIILILAAIFNKSEFGSFAILSAVMQFLSVLVQGGVVEIVTPCLITTVEKSQKIRNAFIFACSIIIKRLLIIFAFSAIIILFLLTQGMVEFQSIKIGWYIIFAIAGILNGIANVYIPILTNAGEHNISIVFRAKLIIIQNIFGLSLALLFYDIKYYAVALILIPILLFGKELIKIRVSKLKLLKYTDNVQINYFLVNSVLNWCPWYGLAFAIGVLLGKDAAAEYALVTNIASVVLITAGGFSQAFTSLQFRSDRSIADQSVGRVIAMQIILLSILTTLILLFYNLLTYYELINQNYRHLHEKILITLFSIVLSSAYFITVSLYSLSNRGLELLIISIISGTIASACAFGGYAINKQLFPYIFFSIFFITRAALVCKNSGYVWRIILVQNKSIFNFSAVLFLVSLIICIGFK